MSDRDFFNWLAGFIDGEGCFYITRDSKRSVWRARFALTVRSDDRPVVEEAQRKTGVGTIHNYFAQSGSQVTRWVVQSRPDCEELVRLLDKYPLRAKKRGDFLIWKRAVATQREIRTGSADNAKVKEKMATLKEELAAERTKGVIHK